jgi:hypothetical protein
MILLTDDEIDEIQKAWIAKGMSGSRSFARAVETAFLAKLASAELPEPALHHIDKRAIVYPSRGY